MTPQKLVGILSALTVLIFSLVFGWWAWSSRTLSRDRWVKKDLIVLSYKSFTSPVGPGPSLFKEFEKSCNCKVDLIAASDAGQLLEKLKMAQEKTHVDLVIGLDQLQLERALSDLKWKELKIETSGWDEKILEFKKAQFIPYDWAPLSFVYRKSHPIDFKNPQEFLDSKQKLRFALQDPRTSTPGAQFFVALSNWFPGQSFDLTLDKVMALDAQFLGSWSASYGFFQTRQADLVFSYVTSLAYHRLIEGNDDFDVVSFSQGHPLQIEYMSIPENCKQCELAESFIKFSLQESSQKQIMEKNFMYPVLKDVVRGTVFEDLPVLKILSMDQQKMSDHLRQQNIEKWVGKIKK